VAQSVKLAQNIKLLFLKLLHLVFRSSPDSNGSQRFQICPVKVPAYRTMTGYIYFGEPVRFGFTPGTPRANHGDRFFCFRSQCLSLPLFYKIFLVFLHNLLTEYNFRVKLLSEAVF